MKHSPEAFKLMMDGSDAFADIEENGIRIDIPYLVGQEDEVEKEIGRLEGELKQDPLWGEWTKIHGMNSDLGKREQLSDIVFGTLGFQGKRKTKNDKWATDQSSFEGIYHPFVNKWSEMAELKTLRDTFIKGVLSESAQGLLRPMLGLNIATSFRSNCEKPNGQNIPNRNPKIASRIRRGFIPRSKDRVIIESDFSGAEVRAACPYHNDPVMMKYIKEGYDLHEDMAGQCFNIDQSRVSKAMRGCAKGMFVFAAFYGDWFMAIARNMWGAVDYDKLKTKDGVLVRDHLNSVGLKVLGGGDPRKLVPGSFEEHMQRVDDKFWNERFRVYTEWKERWWREYLSKGYIQMLTGFICQGVMGRNDVINYPIQGTSFHFLLWVLIELNLWMKEHKMRSQIILQIHDSIILDAFKNEVQTILTKIKELVTIGLPNHWGWINVPLAVESFVGENNWWDKEEWVDTTGVWAPKKKAA